MTAGAVNLVEVFGQIRDPLLLSLLAQHFAVTDDGIERRAQLVTHIGEEYRLGAIRRIGLLHRLLEFGLTLLEFGNVGEHADGTAVRRTTLADAGPNLFGRVFRRAFWFRVVV